MATAFTDFAAMVEKAQQAQQQLLASAEAAFNHLKVQISGTVEAVGQLAGALESLRDRLQGSVQSVRMPASGMTATPRAPQSGSPGGSGDASMDGALAAAGAVGAVFAAVKKVIDNIAGKFDELKSVMMETISAFRPVEVKLFQRAMLDLQATFGQMLIPALRMAESVVKSLSSYVYSLPAEFREFIATLAKVALVVTGAAAAAVAIGGLLATLAPLGGLAGQAAAVIGVLGYAFATTAGGGQFLRDALKTVEQAFAGVMAAGQAVWAALAPVRARLSEAFDGMGKAMSKFLDAIKPLLGGAIVVAALMLEAALKGIIFVIDAIARSFTKLVKDLTWVLNGLTGGSAAVQLPETDRPKKSAEGLGWGGGSVSDPMAAYKSMQQQILANARPPDEKENRILTPLNDIKKAMEKCRDYLQILAEISGGPARAAKAPAQVAGRGLFGVARIILGR